MIIPGVVAQMMSGAGGPPAPTPHRYWRARGWELQGGVGNFALNTLQMRSSIGGSDLCSGGTPLSDSDFDASYVKGNAFDGNDSTIWSSTTGGVNGSHWIGYDFGSAVSIVEVRIVSRSDYILSNATTIVMEYSDDGSTWVESWSNSIMANWTAGEARVLTKPFSIPSVTRWRVRFISNYAANGFDSVAEMEWRSSLGGSDVAGGATITASSAFDGTVPVSNTRDGNGGTWWTSNGTRPTWIKAEFGSPVSIAQVMIQARSDVPTLLPNNLHIQYSTDDIVWTDSTLLNGGVSVSAGEQKLFNTAYNP